MFSVKRNEPAFNLFHAGTAKSPFGLSINLRIILHQGCSSYGKNISVINVSPLRFEI